MKKIDIEDLREVVSEWKELELEPIALAVNSFKRGIEAEKRYNMIEKNNQKFVSVYINVFQDGPGKLIHNKLKHADNEAKGRVRISIINTKISSGDYDRYKILQGKKPL